MSTVTSSSYPINYTQPKSLSSKRQPKPTLRNIKSSARSATQSWVAVHLPIPPFPANCVQRASSPH
ncbi:hypothetical protein PILCRDRAFT_275636 [Piloderma croceum F 1598]|uniref:Uncharacterized protein n=1 Tax=Piloderma croceum (strain F 1598) TaxID=765440 RepID=A0A0C3CCH8_PILCF|nr:hypothetical protein PILCRDRAFT_275636 [Piloderma croceum F 1598]